MPETSYSVMRQDCPKASNETNRNIFGKYS